MPGMTRRYLLPGALILGLTGCFPLPVEDDRHPELPALSEFASNEDIEVVALLDSPHVEAVVRLDAGRFVVHLFQRNPDVDFNVPGRRAVLAESLLVFDGATLVKRIDARAQDLAAYDASTQWLPLVVGANGDIHWLGRQYRAGDLSARDMKVVGSLEVSDWIGERAGVPVLGETEAMPEAPPADASGKTQDVEDRVKALAAGVTAFDDRNGVCVHAGKAWLIRGCANALRFGAPVWRSHALTDHLPDAARRAKVRRGKGLCDEGAAHCWDKVVVANHCSSNHYVFGCRQSYIHYADLPVGGAVMRFKSVPGRDAPFSVHRIDADQVVMASQKGVYLVRRAAGR